MYVQAWTWGNQNELYHHGIMGQRWGKKNGPPYPLAPGDHSAAESRLKSTNDGKLESWRSKETSAITKKHSKKINKLSSKIAKSKNEAKTKKYEEQKAKIEKVRDDEIRVVMNMSLSDVKKERLYVGKRRVAGALKVTGTLALASTMYAPGANILLGAALGMHLYNKKHNSKQALKEKYRTVEHPKEVERSKQKAEAKKEYDQAKYKLVMERHLPMEQRIEKLEKKNKQLYNYTEDHGVSTKTLPRIVKMTNDPELTRLYSEYLDDREEVNKKAKAAGIKLSKWL